MTETEYIQVGNLKALRIALNIVGDILPGPEYGVTREDLADVCERLYGMTERLSESRGRKPRRPRSAGNPPDRT